MNTLTLGNVPYLNTKPLVALLDIENPLPVLGQPTRIEMIEAVPSRLVGMLERREVAAAMLSSIIALSDPSLCALPAGAVTSDGPVRSIRLFSRVPVSKIRRLALDANSRTSVVLCRILLARVYGLWPDIVSLPPDPTTMLEAADAALLIGDPALRTGVAVERGEMPGVHVDIDLGSLWRSEIGLPFVYAVWTAPRDGDVRSLTEVLSRAAAWGVERLAEIAEREAPRIHLPVDVCRDYLTQNICYDFGPRERAGMYRFREEAIALGLAPEFGLATDVIADTANGKNPGERSTAALREGAGICMPDGP